MTAPPRGVDVAPARWSHPHPGPRAARLDDQWGNVLKGSRGTGRLATAAIATVALAYTGTSGALYLGQRSLLYFPTAETELAGADALRAFL